MFKINDMVLFNGEDNSAIGKVVELSLDGKTAHVVYKDGVSFWAPCSEYVLAETNLEHSFTSLQDQLKQFADQLPDLDAYSAVYSVAMDEVERLSSVMQQLEQSLKEAKELAKQHPNHVGKCRF